MTIVNKKILKKRIMNIVFLLVFSVLAISAYYIGQFSKAKEIVEINVNVKDFAKENEITMCSLKATKENGESDLYIKLPEYIENKKVIKYTYTIDDNLDTKNDLEVAANEKETKVVVKEKLEENIKKNKEIETKNLNEIVPDSKNEITSTVSEKQDNKEENKNETITEQKNEVDVSNTIKGESENNKTIEKSNEINQTEENYILPYEKIYLTDEQINNKSVTIFAIYDTKEKGDTTLYKQILTKQVNDCWVTVIGYMPQNAELEIGEIEKKNVEDKIRKQTKKPIVLAAAYDVKVVVNEKVYEPYEFDEKIDIKLTKQLLGDKQTNIWHINDKNKAEQIKNNITDGFSEFGIEDVALTALAAGRLSDNILTIDDADSDRYYWMGQNYTTDTTGNYVANYTNFANVTLNYYGYVANEVDPDMIGYVSLTEQYNVVQYQKTCPIINGKVSIELIDNPFIDRPEGYGFGGWVCSGATITKDTNTKMQTLSMTASSNMTIDVYANWKTAKVVYVDGEAGLDSNDGLTPETAKGSWGAAINYLNQNSNDRTDRERNIVVMTGDMPTSFNYTNPVDMQTVSDITYTSATNFTSGGTYILANGTGNGSHAITANGTWVTDTTLSTTTEPPETAKWIITTTSNGKCTIRNASTGNYLAYNYGLTVRTSSYEWTVYNNRSFYSGSGNTYIRYNRGWTVGSQSNRLQFNFLTYQKNDREERVVEDTETNSYYSTTNNTAFTVTSLYGHTDYRDTATMDLTQNSYQDILAYADLQVEYLSINGTGYKSACSGGTTVSANYPRFYGRGNNFRIGRGLNLVSTNETERAAAGAVIGGYNTGTTIGSNSSTGSNHAYRLVVESGKYCTALGWNQYNVTSHYYGTVYFTLGSDIDRKNNNNDNLSVYYRTTINAGGGANGRNNIRDKSCLIDVKSGKFGIDDFDEGNGDTYTSGIYIGGYGTQTSSTTRDFSDRYMIVEGGLIANINCGLKIYSANTDVLTKLYVKGGEMYNIVGGAGQSTTYGSRILQITGGKVRYSVSGGSNGYSGDDGDGQITDCDTLVYVGGNAQIGDETLVGYITDSVTTNDNNGKLYLVEAGCVLGAGNGNNPDYSLGQVDNTHIIVNDSAHILNSVYGGGNYGVVGSSGSTNAVSKIDILGGTIDRNVYGGSNNSNTYGSTTINMKNGTVKGGIYGGSNTSGTISTTTTVNITGGTLGITSNTIENGVLFGGGYGSSTVISSNATVNILDTDNNVTIYGSGYGGSSLGKINGNTQVTIKDSPTVNNVISIKGSIFAGGKGNSSTAATIAGTSNMIVDGSNLPECSVFGGNDINGTTSGNITVTIGQNDTSKIQNVYGGGNQAAITTTTPQVKVYLLSHSDVTNAFNGGKAANLLSSGESDTSRAIYLQGGTVTNIFGGSDSSGTVTASHVYIESGTATNVYGGNNIAGTTTTSHVNVTGGTITNVYGGGFKAETATSNVSLTNGTITNGFGGGNAANVTNANITLAGTQCNQNIYGGSNQEGTVNNTNVEINSGTVQDVYGGNNAGGNTVNATVVITGNTVRNVFGGGNEAITSGNTSVKLSNATITGSAFGGGNGEAAVVSGNGEIMVEGTTSIAEDLFGGGNAATTGTESNPSEVYVYIAGGTVGGDIYGAANTSVVTGRTYVKIGTNAITGKTLTKNNINITGTVFGGGKSNSAGSDDYDFTFLSVIGNTYIDIDALGYDDGTYTFNIGKSIFGSGNAATMSGDGYVNISNYGSQNNIKDNISIQRVTTLTINNSGMFLEGTTDRTNEISTTAYSFNRIKELIIKNNTTLYLASGANILEKLTSVDSSNNKATVNIGTNGTITKNVDNKIYLLQGKNLILATEIGAHGEVSGMTYVGLFKGRLNRDTGIYGASFSNGDTVPENMEEFARNSYVQGKHYYTGNESSHNIQVDGFYTNYNVNGTIETKYIEPTPESAQYYQWIVGKVSDDIYYEGIELIATKYSTTSAYVLSLNGLSAPNTTIDVIDVDTSDLNGDVLFVDEDTIPNIEMDISKANSVFGLTMTAGNTGWQTKGKTEFLRDTNEEDAEIEGSTQFLSENAESTPTFSFYMAHSKNVSENKALGTVTIHLQATYVENEEITLKNVYIVLTLSTNNMFKLANDYYEGAITPGREYNMFPTTTTSITSKSSFSAYYSLYLGNYSTDEEYYDNFVGYNHWLISSCVLPEKTKITMIDRSKDTVKYYYYTVTASDEQTNRKEFKFKDFTAMGSTNEPYNADQSYLNTTMDLVYEEFIFQIDFEDITLTNTFENQSLIVQLRDMWDDTIKITVNTDQYPMLFNLYSDKEAIKNVTATADKEYIYIGEDIGVNLEAVYRYQTQNSDTIYDTTYFEDQMGLRVTILDGSTALTVADLTGVAIEHNGTRYYARSDGSYRIKLADAISNILTDFTIHTDNASLESKTYTFKFETFGSFDGIYYSKSIASDTVNIQVVNTDYGLIANLDANCLSVDKKTGNTLNDNNQLNFEVGYSGDYTNPNIKVVLYRRNYDSIYSTQYDLVDLADYVSNQLIETDEENQYLVTANPTNTQNFNLNLKQNLTSGTYKFKFILYDGDMYIGDVEKMIIIK